MEGCANAHLWLWFEICCAQNPDAGFLEKIQERHYYSFTFPAIEIVLELPPRALLLNEFESNIHGEEARCVTSEEANPS